MLFKKRLKGNFFSLILLFMENNQPLEKPRKKKGKLLTILLLVLLVGLGSFIYVRYYFVFGSGIKTGTLNYVVHKGYLFKTYEGEMILYGITSGNDGIKSNEFLFSVDNREVADKLMRMGGKQVELYYKEYLAPLPWRGYSKFVVDSIVSIQNVPRLDVLPLTPDHQP